MKSRLTFAAPRPCLHVSAFSAAPYQHVLTSSPSSTVIQGCPNNKSHLSQHSTRTFRTWSRNAEGFAQRNVIQRAFAPPRADRGMMWVWYFLLGSGSVGESIRLHPLFLWISFWSAISTAVAVVFQQSRWSQLLHFPTNPLYEAARNFCGIK